MAKRKKYKILARQHVLEVGAKTLVMGILNVTPDSFSGDGQLKPGGNVQAAVREGLWMVRSGADIIDVGGESTRPGAEKISWQEEKRRVVPVVKALALKISVPISVDTYKPEVAQAALEAGASIVNVVQGTPISSRLLRIVKRYKAAIVLMHTRGVPKTMQSKVDYRDLLKNISSEIKKSVEKCLDAGIKREQIIVDPGIGFAKTVDQNLRIVHRLSFLNSLKLPILVGPSRKSFIGKVLDLPVDQRLMGTAAAVALSIANGAHVVRVHDVVEMKQVARIADAINSEGLL